MNQILLSHFLVSYIAFEADHGKPQYNRFGRQGHSPASVVAVGGLDADSQSVQCPRVFCRVHLLRSPVQQ